MIPVGRILLRVIASVEVSIFCIYLIWGAHGMRAIRAMQEKNEALAAQMLQAEHELQTTRSEIQDWKTYPFYKEQYAREHLQMARKDDDVYLI